MFTSQMLVYIADVWMDDLLFNLPSGWLTDGISNVFVTVINRFMF